MFKIAKLLTLSWDSLSLRSTSIAVLLAVGLCAPAKGGGLIENGSFENWAITSGNKGLPDGWGKALGNSKGDLTRVSKIGGGPSGYAALISKDTALSTAVQSNNGKLELGFVMAATNPDSLTNRSFNLILTQSSSPTTGSGGIINIRATTSATDASKLRLQAISGTSWMDIADGLLPSVYDAGSNSFTTLNAYSFVLTLDLMALEPSYSLSYGLVGESMSTVSNIKAFWTAPAQTGITYTIFNGNSSATPYAIGEVYAVPEGRSAIAVLGIAALAMLLIRNKKGLHLLSK